MQLGSILNINNLFTLSINGADNLFFEGCIGVYNIPYLWIPMLLALLYVILKNNNLKEFLTITLLLVAIFALTYTVARFLMQPLFNYIYATTANNIELKKETVSFINSANVFAIALFLSMLIRHKALTISFILWACIGCYIEFYMLRCTLLYILLGAIIGAFCGFFAYRLFRYSPKKQSSSRRDWISNRFTKNGYEVPDVYFLLVILYGTFAIIPIISFLLFNIA